MRSSRRSPGPRHPGGFLALAVLAALVAGGCGDNQTPLKPFSLSLVFDPANGGPRACTQRCSAYRLDCRALLAVRIADAYDVNDELDFRCAEIPPTGATLCSLNQVDIEFAPIPAGTAHVGVALWRASLLPDGRCLRAPLFDLQGEPLITLRPQPAVAGATFFEVGVDEEVLVPMACSFPEQITAAMCTE